MELDNFNVNACDEMSEILPSNIKRENFDQITEIIKAAFYKLGIKTEGMSIYYQRYANSTSILAIKVSQGDDNDISNYMFNGCSAYDRLCNVYLHAEAKSAQKSASIASLISRQIVSFFENVEQDLFESDLGDIEIFIKIPLDKKVEQTLTPKESRIKKLIRSIFQK